MFTESIFYFSNFAECTHTQNRERIERAYVRVSSENHPNIHVRLNGVFIHVKIIAFMLFMLMSKSIFQCILLLLLRAFAVASFYIMSFVLQNIFFCWQESKFALVFHSISRSLKPFLFSKKKSFVFNFHNKERFVAKKNTVQKE